MLRRPSELGRLLDALAGVDRLVLLGDVIELRHSRIAQAFNDAAPVFAEIGAALGPEREVVLVAGNHDHHLAEAWLERRTLHGGDGSAPLALDSPVDWQLPEPLATVASWLAPARVSAAYPGIWLRDDVYATHGHYLDRHTTVPLLERVGVGLMARIMRGAPAVPAGPDDYEAMLAPIYAWIHAVAQSGAHQIGDSTYDPSTRGWRVLTQTDGPRSLRQRGLVAAFPALIVALNRAGLGPLRADLSGVELRRAGLRAFIETVTRLGIDAPYVLFGHTHRAGPLPGDDPSEWRTPAGGQVINCGSWAYQPDFLGDDPSVSPYRAGFGVLVADEGAPELLNLLDGVIQPVPA